MDKDYTKKMYKTINELIEYSKGTEEKSPASKGLLNRTSRGRSTEDVDVDAPLLKVVEYVKQFRKMREGLKDG